MARPKKHVATPKTVSKPEVKVDVAQEAAPQVEEQKEEVVAMKASEEELTQINQDLAEEFIIGYSMLSLDNFRKANSKLHGIELNGFEAGKVWEAEKKLAAMRIGIEPSTIKSVLKTDFKMDIDEVYLENIRTKAKASLGMNPDHIIEKYVVRRG